MVSQQANRLAALQAPTVEQLIATAARAQYDEEQREEAKATNTAARLRELSQKLQDQAK